MSITIEELESDKNLFEKNYNDPELQEIQAGYKFLIGYIDALIERCNEKKEVSKNEVGKAAIN